MATSRIGCVSGTLGLRSVVSQNPIVAATKIYRDTSRVSPSIMNAVPRRFPRNLLSRSTQVGEIEYEESPVPTTAEGPFTHEEAILLPFNYIQYISGYHYCTIENSEIVCKELVKQLGAAGVVGRIYVDQGINLQISCHPSLSLKAVDIIRNVCNGVFREARIFTNEITSTTPLFRKLVVKKRNLLNTGLPEEVTEDFQEYSNQFQHLSPDMWHAKMKENSQRKDSVIFDVRNLYEYELGSFTNAKPVEVATYSETYPEIDRMLGLAPSKGVPLSSNTNPIVPTPNTAVAKDAPIMIYCTGGIRCVPLGSYLAKQGYTNVATLEGGVNAYAEWSRQVMSNPDEESLFQGSNVVFDDRRAVKVTPSKTLSKCWYCARPSDKSRNCSCQSCDILILQCQDCETLLNGACSINCNQIQFGQGKQVREAILHHNSRAQELSQKPTSSHIGTDKPWTYSRLKYVPASPGHSAFRPRISPLIRL